jgi:hypothetical protein
MAAKYKVISINKRGIMRPDGTFGDVYEVAFETSFGVKSTIQIPPDQLSAEHVKKELDKFVATLESIMNV